MVCWLLQEVLLYFCIPPFAIVARLRRRNRICFSDIIEMSVFGICAEGKDRDPPVQRKECVKNQAGPKCRKDTEKTIKKQVPPK